MAALIFLVQTLLSLAMLAVLLRLLLQWSRADFRNPLARAIVQLTNPVIVPMRRLLPAIGRIDTACCVVVLVLAGIEVVVPWLLTGSGVPEPLDWAAPGIVRDTAHHALDLFLRDLRLRHVVDDRAGRVFAGAKPAGIAL